MLNSSHDEGSAIIAHAYKGAVELLVRVAHALENGLLYSAKRDGPTALGLAGWLFQGASEKVRINEAIKLVFVLTVLLEDDIFSHAINNGPRALRAGAQLVNALSGISSMSGQTYIRIRDDLICWSDEMEFNAFPHRNNGPEALRLAAELLKLTIVLA